MKSVKFFLLFNATCPLNKKCLSNSIIYQCTVSTAQRKETYVGQTANTFKQRYNNHKFSFSNNNLRYSTELSIYIWHLKDSNTNYTLSWQIIRQAQSYSNTSKSCRSCTWEKFFILYCSGYGSGPGRI